MLLGRVEVLRPLPLPLDQVVLRPLLLPLRLDQVVHLLLHPLPLVGLEFLLLPLEFLELPLPPEVFLPLQEPLVVSGSSARLDSRIRRSINSMFR